MASILEQLPRQARVAVVRLRSLGDCVLTTPALALLKSSRPDLQIAVVVENRFRPVFEGNPEVGALLDPQPLALRAWRPDLCLDLHGGRRAAMLTMLSGAEHRAGFAHYRFSFVYSIKIPTAQEILQVARKVHTVEHLASAAFHLGAPAAEIPRARLYPDVEPSPTAATYAIFHPFASAPGKAWPPARFAALAGHVQTTLDLEPIFIGAAGDDFTPFRRWRTLAGAPLAEVKPLLAGAAVFVGNDSGPAHMAAAFGIPVVVLFGASDPAIWGPWLTPAEVLWRPDGIAAIPERDVIAALARLQVHA